MIIRHKHKCILFHVAKVTGISIHEAPSPCLQAPECFQMPQAFKGIKGQPTKLYQGWDSALTHATVRHMAKALLPATSNRPTSNKWLNQLAHRVFVAIFLMNYWHWIPTRYINIRGQLSSAC